MTLADAVARFRTALAELAGIIRPVFEGLADVAAQAQCERHGGHTMARDKATGALTCVYCPYPVHGAL